jgi:hypothetical protein
MTIYLWTVLVLFALGFLGNLKKLAARDITQTTSKDHVIHLLLGLPFLAWGIWVLYLHGGTFMWTRVILDGIAALASIIALGHGKPSYTSMATRVGIAIHSAVMMLWAFWLLMVGV